MYTDDPETLSLVEMETQAEYVVTEQALDEEDDLGEDGGDSDDDEY